MAYLFNQALALVRGAGDLGSGVIYRLVRAGFPVVACELPQPSLVRRGACYGEAVYAGRVELDGLCAVFVHTLNEVQSALHSGMIPVIVDRNKVISRILQPAVVVDARMMKYNPDTKLSDAPLVLALGPGYEAGRDCHAVIETNRGHFLGRVYWEGAAEADTGEPGIVKGHTYSRVLRAPLDGYVQSHAAIGDLLQEGDLIAQIGEVTIAAPFTGVLRGLVHEQVLVRTGMKIGDLDPRASREHCFTISDKALAVGGGVVEAVLSASQIRQVLVAGDR